MEDKSVSLGPHVDGVNGRVAPGDGPEEAQESCFTILVMPEPIGLDLAGVTIGKGVMAIIEIGTGPWNRMPIEPGSSKFGLEALAQEPLDWGLR